MSKAVRTARGSAMDGSTTASLIVGLISITMLYITVYRDLQKSNNDRLKIIETVKTMFRYGLPLSVSVILAGSLTQFYNFLIAIYCTDLMIGNYQVALNFAVLITLFTGPISTVLFPAFSKLNPQRETETLRNVFQSSVKYAAYLVVPAAAAVISLSQPAVSTLFGEKYTDAPPFLALCAVSYLYSAFGSLSLGNLIKSQGKTEVSLKLTLITATIGFPLSLLLIPKFGITGLILTTLVAGIPSLIIMLWYVKKHFTATISWASSAKTILASILAAAITYVVISQLSLANWTKLVIGALIIITTYATTAPLIGAMNKTDVQNLREMLTELGPISHMFNPPLTIIEKLTNLS